MFPIIPATLDVREVIVGAIEELARKNPARAQTMAWPAFRPDFLIIMMTMITSSTASEIESTTVVHLHKEFGL
jgi:hypothetical protein